MGKQERLNPAHLLQTAPARVRDSVGRVLEPGDEVLVVAPKFPMRVAQVTPILEAPGVPPGMMKLVLVCRLAVVIPRDACGEDLYFLRHQAEIGDGAIDLGQGAAGEGQEEPPA